MNRFAVLHHVFPPNHEREDHWDLLFEWEGKLLTWSLKMPLKPGQIPASPLQDHRLEYLEFEGEIAGDRGSVTRILEGTYRWLTSDKKSALLFDGSRSWKLDFETQEESETILQESEMILRISPGPME